MSIHSLSEEDPQSVLPALAEALGEHLEEIRSFKPPQNAHHEIAFEKLCYPLSFEAWSEMIAGAQALMAKGKLDKVVLSRIAGLFVRAPC
ncbi:MAG: hypothetical protein R2865_03210 [Deinococcales bacterium]